MSSVYGGPSCMNCGLKLNECECVEEEFCGKSQKVKMKHTPDCNHEWVNSEHIEMDGFTDNLYRMRICQLCEQKEKIIATPFDTCDELLYQEINRREGMYFADTDSIIVNECSELDTNTCHDHKEPTSHQDNHVHDDSYDLQKITDNMWLFGYGSGFGLVHEESSEEYYLLDLVSGATSDGEAVQVWHFTEQTDLETELAIIQEWFSIFIMGILYAHERLSRFQQKERCDCEECGD